MRKCNVSTILFHRSITLIFPQNELAILEFIHNVVEALDRYFSSVVSCV